MNIYTMQDYRMFIKSFADYQKQLGHKITYQQIAEYIKTPKSYLSKVLQGDGNLNSDQMYRICKLFNLSVKERNFVLLLLEFERCSDHERKIELKDKIESIRKKMLASESVLEVSEVSTSFTKDGLYFCDPWNQIIHMCLFIKKYREKPLLLPELLGLSKIKFAECLTHLEKYGVIKIYENKKIEILKNNIHLPFESPLFLLWRNSLRTISLQKANTMLASDSYSVSAVFNTNEQGRAEIKSLFLNFLQETQMISQKYEPEGVYQINFDLLPWLNHS